MNANWIGAARQGRLGPCSRRSPHDRRQGLRESLAEHAKPPTTWYSVSGAGSPRHRRASASKNDGWSLTNPDDVNGGVNHFGSPFNFPEEFVTVYRLHPLVPGPDRATASWREPERDPQQDSGGRDVPRPGDRLHARARAGELGAQHGPPAAGPARRSQNHPQFLQNLEMPRLRQPDAADRRRRARPHPRPRARRAALQRVPPPVRAAAAHQLRRFHRPATADGLARARRAGSAGRRRCARCTGSTGATHRRSSPTRS